MNKRLGHQTVECIFPTFRDFEAPSWSLEEEIRR
jgi:hypothetical protein